MDRLICLGSALDVVNNSDGMTILMRGIVQRVVYSPHWGKANTFIPKIRMVLSTTSPLIQTPILTHKLHLIIPLILPIVNPMLQTNFLRQ